MILAVAVQHVVVDRLERRWRRRHRFELLGREREAVVADEALVVDEYRRDVFVACDEPDHRLAVESRLAENGIVLAHGREDRVRVRPELGAVELVFALHDGHGERLLLDSPRWKRAF